MFIGLRCRPVRFALLRIQKLAATLAGPDQPAEEYHERTGRLNMARLQAEVPLLKR